MEPESPPELRIDDRLFVWLAVGIVFLVVPAVGLAVVASAGNFDTWGIKMGFGAVGLLFFYGWVMLGHPMLIEFGEQLVVRRLLSRRTYEWSAVKRLNIGKDRGYLRLTIEVEGAKSLSCWISAADARRIRLIADRRGLPINPGG